MIVTPQEMRDAESAAFSGAVDAESAMEEAGLRLAEFVRRHFPDAGTLLLCTGTGNNAGDAFVAGRVMRQWGWDSRWFPADGEAEFSELAGKKYREWVEGGEEGTTDAGLGLAEVAGSRRPWVVLDGILGTGAAGPPRLAAAELIGKLIQWRESRGVFVVAIDIPSGLDGESGVVQDPSVVADLTATLGAVKSGLLADGAIDHVGRLSLLPLTGIEMLTGDEGRELIDPVRLREWWRPSDHSLHKGLAGRVAVVAGSPGMTGAAALTAGAALHAGAGLVTVWTHPGCVREVAMRCPPEIMVRTLPQGRLSMLPVKGVDVVALGPGCGDWLAGQIPGFYRDCPVAMVVDADGLNHIAPMSCRVQPVASRLLTPHAGEFARLAPDLAGCERAEQARRFVDRHVDVCLLLKGGRTLVARRGSKLLYNGTGHYGMAGAGMGDVLTGICAAMVCRTGDSYAGAALAAWLHGRAAELATPLGVRDRSSLTASEVIGHFGAAAAALSREDD